MGRVREHSVKPFHQLRSRVGAFCIGPSKEQFVALQGLCQTWWRSSDRKAQMTAGEGGSGAVKRRGL
jgi:hypothetical protein